MTFNTGLKQLILSLLVASALLVTGTSVAATPSSVPSGTTNGSAADSARSDRNEELRSALQAVVDAGATGVIALVDDGEYLSRLAVGAAQLEPRRGLRVRDQVRVGSITKTFIATIVLQLVDEGRMTLDDTVEQWLPGLVANGSAITLRMLLNHTSGIFNYTDDENFFPAVFADPFRQWVPQEFVDIANEHPPTFPPGEGWSYSNTGYIVIGMMVEKATGDEVEDLVKARIARPLRLHKTFLATSARFRGRSARGYAPPSLTGGGYEDLSTWSPSIAWSAGALVSNARDLARFYQALLSGRVLNPALLDAMTTTVETGVGFSYGLGIFALETPCGMAWGHSGGIPGYVSFALNTRDGSRSTVLLLSTEPDEAIGMALDQALVTAVCQMFGQTVPELSAPMSATPG